MVTQQIINGLALGMGYALIAVGYSLVFGILRLVNFSHGWNALWRSSRDYSGNVVNRCAGDCY